MLKYMLKLSIEWCSWLRLQSGDSEVVGFAGGEKLAVGRTFSGQSYKIFFISGHAFHPTQAIELGTWH